MNSAAACTALTIALASCGGGCGERGFTAQRLQEDAGIVGSPESEEATRLADQYHETVGHARRALMANLRFRSLLARTGLSRPRAWIPDVDRRIQLLVAVLCGDHIDTTVGRLDVLSTPAEELLPMDAIERATSFDCVGLSTGARDLEVGPWFVERRVPRHGPAAP